jgi:hypothetical protein
MPTVLDTRTHKRLRFVSDLVESTDSIPSLSAIHPDNSKVKVEGVRFSPTNSMYAVGVMEEGGQDLFVLDAMTSSVKAIVGRKTGVHDDEETIEAGSYLDKKKDLINTYAPVKKQRQLRAAINAVVSDEKIEGFQESVESMKQSLLNANDGSEQRESCGNQSSGALGQMRALLPPFDLETSAPEEIYDFSALFPDSLISALDPNEENSACNALLRWIHEDFLPIPSTTTVEQDSFAEMKRLNTLAQLGRLYGAAKQEKRKAFAKLLSILVSMIFLYKARRSKQWSPYDIYANETLASQLASLYSPQKEVGQQIDREGATKLLAHICLFALRLSPSWEFDFADLKRDLSIQPKELSSILVFCGISVKSASGRNGLVGKLKAPLTIQTGTFGNKAKTSTPKRK